MVRIEACIIDSESRNTVMTSSFNVIWEKFLEGLGFGFPTNKKKDGGLLNRRIGQLPHDSGQAAWID